MRDYLDGLVDAEALGPATAEGIVLRCLSNHLASVQDLSGLALAALVDAQPATAS